MKLNMKCSKHEASAWPYEVVKQGYLGSSYQSRKHSEADLWYYLDLPPNVGWLG